jgi:hypothetical protein
MPIFFVDGYANGERGPKLDLRPMLADFLREIDLDGMVREAVAAELRANPLRPW